jgi:hypothetical protein
VSEGTAARAIAARLDEWIQLGRAVWAASPAARNSGAMIVPRGLLVTRGSGRRLECPWGVASVAVGVTLGDERRRLVGRISLYKWKRATGIEPVLRAWKALVQPLHHARGAT